MHQTSSDLAKQSLSCRITIVFVACRVPPTEETSMNFIHSRLTPAFACAFNQACSFSSKLFEADGSFSAATCNLPTRTYQTARLRRPLSACLCLKSCPDVILMGSPGSGDLRLGLIFYSSADLLHSLDVDVRLHFQALPVDGLKERA